MKKELGYQKVESILLPFDHKPGITIDSIVNNGEIILELRNAFDLSFRCKVIVKNSIFAYQKHDAVWSIGMRTKDLHKLSLVNIIQNSLWIDKLNQDPIFSATNNKENLKHYMVNAENCIFEAVTDSDLCFVY